MATTSRVIIKGENSITSAVKSAQKDISSLSSTVTKFNDYMKKAFTVTAVLASLNKIKNAVKDLAKDYLEIEQTYARLNAASELNGQSLDKLTSIVDKFSKQTLESKDTVRSLVSQMASMGKSSGEIDKLTQASNAFAKVTGKSLQESFNQILGTLSGELGDLKKLGIEFQNLTSDQLKNGKAVDVLISKYGELSKQMSESSFAQDWKDIGDVFDSIKQNSGKVILQFAEDSGFTSFLETTLESIDDWVEKIYLKQIGLYDEVKGQVKQTIGNDSGLNSAENDLLLNSVWSIFQSKYADSATKDWLKYIQIYGSADKIPAEVKNELLLPLRDILKDLKPAIEDYKKNEDSRLKEYEAGLKKREVDDAKLANYLQELPVLEDLLEQYTKAYEKNGKRLVDSSEFGSSPNARLNKRLVDYFTSEKQNKTVVVDGQYLTIEGEGFTDFFKKFSDLVDDVRDRVNSTLETPTPYESDIDYLGELLKKTIEKSVKQQEREPVHLGWYGTTNQNLFKSSLPSNMDLNLFAAQNRPKPDYSGFEDEVQKQIAKIRQEKSDTVLKEFPLLEKYLKASGMANEKIVDFLNSSDFINPLKGEDYIRDFNGSDRISALKDVIDAIKPSMIDDRRTTAFETSISLFDSGLNGLLDTLGPLTDILLSATPTTQAWLIILQEAVDTLLPAIGTTIQPLLDLLKLLGKSLGETLYPILEALYPWISMITNVLANVLFPVIQVVASVMQAISSILYILQPVLQIVCDAFTAIAIVLNWVASLFEYVGDVIVTFGKNVGIALYNVLHPFSQKSYESTSKSYKSFNEAADEVLNRNNDAYFSSIDIPSQGQQAVQNASYTGMGSLTINIYQEAPVVGDGGMEQFAKMVRAEFEALDWYGV